MKCIDCKHLNTYGNGYYFCLRHKFSNRISEKAIDKDKKCDLYDKKERGNK